MLSISIINFSNFNKLISKWKLQELDQWSELKSSESKSPSGGEGRLNLPSSISSNALQDASLRYHRLVFEGLTASSLLSLRNLYSGLGLWVTCLLSNLISIEQINHSIKLWPYSYLLIFYLHLFSWFNCFISSYL